MTEELKDPYRYVALIIYYRNHNIVCDKLYF